MNTNDTYEIFEAYLQGKLPPEEKKALDLRMEKDYRLAKKFHHHQIANDLLINRRLQEVDQLLKNRKKPTFKIKNIFYITTITITLLSLFLWFYYPIEETVEADYIPTAKLKLKKVPTHTDIRPSQTSPILKTPTKNTLFNENIINTIPDSVIVTVPDSGEVNSFTPHTSEVLDSLPTIDLHNETLAEVSSDTTPALSTKDTVQLNESNPSAKDSLPKRSNPPQIEKVQLEISPLDDDFDKFPFDYSESGRLFIYSKKGVLIRELNISNGTPNYWDGTDQYGTITPGYYVFKFTGTSKTIVGGITVFY